MRKVDPKRINVKNCNLFLCVFKDFLEDPELRSIKTFFESMDETISFGFESIIHGINSKKEYFDDFIFNNKIQKRLISKG